ncbi:MAG: ferritin family protein [Proteobacteria bacterium]|nr:hypothetical protein [Pseudomonadota bacterium]NOG59672.1 ferritin family protein [Pseudomonadota bacterium]
MIKFEQVEDLLATAQQIELGAAERYMESAKAAQAENPEIAALFQRLAEEEQQHEKDVLALAKDASVDLTTTSVSEQVAQAGNSNNSEKVKDSLYENLVAAVKREERAFEIYSQIAATSINDDVRHYAEILAKEELGHAALLRAMRRRVFHEYKTQIKSTFLNSSDKLTSIDEFLISAYILEESVAKYIENIDETNINSCREHSRSIVEHLKTEISKTTAEDFNKLDDVSDNVLSGIKTFSIDNMMAECESIYEYYDSFILKTENEEIMKKALFLATQNLTQITLLQASKNT